MQTTRLLFTSSTRHAYFSRQADDTLTFPAKQT